MCQILETIPISDEVSDLVQKLGNFYTEEDIDGEEAEENDVGRRPFSQPFAQHKGNVHDYRCHNSIKGKKNTNQGGPCCSAQM